MSKDVEASKNNKEKYRSKHRCKEGGKGHEDGIQKPYNRRWEVVAEALVQKKDDRKGRRSHKNEYMSEVAHAK